MNIKETINKILETKGIQKSTIASRMGITQACLWSRLKSSNKDLTVNKALEVLRAMDYQIVVVPQGTRISSDWYVIGATKDEDSSK